MYHMGLWVHCMCLHVFGGREECGQAEEASVAHDINVLTHRRLGRSMNDLLKALGTSTRSVSPTFRPVSPTRTKSGDTLKREKSGEGILPYQAEPTLATPALITEMPPIEDPGRVAQTWTPRLLERSISELQADVDALRVSVCYSHGTRIVQAAYASLQASAYVSRQQLAEVSQGGLMAHASEHPADRPPCVRCSDS